MTYFSHEWNDAGTGTWEITKRDSGISINRPVSGSALAETALADEVIRLARRVEELDRRLSRAQAGDLCPED